MCLPDEDLVSSPPDRAQRTAAGYVLDGQVGFILRQASQRHAALFASRMGAETTPTQWAALTKLHEIGPTSQNLLGRMTAMDVATIKGVVDRLMKRGLVRSAADKADARRRLLAGPSSRRMSRQPTPSRAKRLLRSPSARRRYSSPCWPS